MVVVRHVGLLIRIRSISSEVQHAVQVVQGETHATRRVTMNTRVVAQAGAGPAAPMLHQGWHACHDKSRKRRQIWQ